MIYLPEHILDLNFLPELKVISKTERYFEFGAAVTLNEILDLGKKIFLLPYIILSKR